MATPGEQTIKSKFEDYEKNMKDKFADYDRRMQLVETQGGHNAARLAVLEAKRDSTDNLKASHMQFVESYNETVTKVKHDSEVSKTQTGTRFLELEAKFEFRLKDLEDKFQALAVSTAKALDDIKAAHGELARLIKF